MSLNEPVRLKSQSKRKRSESERTAKKHAKNKRQKSKRAASPTSSYLSMRTDWSDLPTNFKDGETSPLHLRIKRKRETSPVTSYISLKSDNPMNVSNCNTSDLRERATSPTTSFFSLKTDWSIDRPINFKAAETFPLDPRLLAEQHLKCPVCKLMFKDPVSFPCGHNYCNNCINACAGKYSCPQCDKASETRPALSINAALAEVVKSMKQESFSPALPPQSYAGPEDLACDYCTEVKLKSVKFCSNCAASFCEIHVRHHYTIPALQKHTLSDVTGDIKTRLLQQSQNSDTRFSSTDRGQSHPTDKTQDIIKEMAVAAKPQTRLKRSAKTFRPKTKEKKDNVRSIELMFSTLQQEVSGLKEKLSNLETKNTKKEKYEDEEDYGEEYDEEEDSEEEDDDYGEEDDEKDYGEEYYGDDNEDYSEKDSDSETSHEDNFDDGYKDDYDGEEDDWKENEDEEDYDDENSSEEDYDDENSSKEDYDDENNYEEDYDNEDNSEEDSDEDYYDTDY